MRIHGFTVVLADVSEISDEGAEALFEAGCDDSTPGSSCGAAYVIFDREAATLEDAIRTAVRDVRKAGYQVARIVMDEDDLAELLRVPTEAKA